MPLHRIALATLLAAASFAHAQVVFSTLGPSGTFSTTFYDSDTLGTPPIHSEVGFGFTPTLGGDLTQLRATVQAASSGTAIRLAIYQEAATLPGDLIGSTMLAPPLQPFPQINAFPLPNFPVQAGVHYYISIQTVSMFGGWRWYSSDPIVHGPEIEQRPGQSWTQQTLAALPAFELSIPAPSALPIVVAPIGLLCRRRRGASTSLASGLGRL